MRRVKTPRRGLHDGEAYGDQPAETTAEMTNMLPRTDDRDMVGMRNGMSKYSPNALAAAKVGAMVEVTYDNKKTTYTSLGDSVTVKWTDGNGQSDSKATGIDRQGNRYALTSKTGLTKWNSEHVQILTLDFPVADPLHEIRCVLIGPDDTIYAAVSTGGAMATARFWAFRQTADDKTELLWQVEPGRYIESIDLKDDALYTAQNDTDEERSYIVVYRAIDAANPEASTLREVGYPFNCLSVSRKDGSLAVALGPNASRGVSAKNPDRTARAEDWTPKNLTNWQKRVRCYFDFTDPDYLDITREPNSDTDANGEINVAFDVYGSSRVWVKDATGAGTHRGPTFRPGVGAHFNGTNQSMIGIPATSTDASARNESLSILPTHAGAQFVCVMLVRLASSSSQRYVLVQDGTTVRGIIAHSQPTGALAGTAADYAIRLHETGGTASDASSSAPNATAPSGNGTTPLAGPIGAGGWCLVTWVCDGNVHDQFGTATRSTIRFNGMTADRWQSATFTSTNGTQLGFHSTGGIGTISGDVVDMIVLHDWYDADGARQRLITLPDHPDDPFSFSTAATTELEQLEGWIMNKRGLAHLLPAGPAIYLYDNAGGTLNDGNTVVVNGTTYTAKAALTPAANEFLIGASLAASLTNLRRAVNGEGTPGTDYGSQTVPNTSYRALGPIGYQNSSPPRVAVLFRAIDPYSAAAAFSRTEAATDTLGFATGTLTTTGTGTKSMNSDDSFQDTGAYALAKNTNWYPHPYYIKRLDDKTFGGPPRATDGQLAVPSKPGLLTSSPYGVLAKLDPNNGRVRWVFTTGYTGLATGSSNTGYGGLGYFCKWNSAGDLYSGGPRQAAVSSPITITVEDVDVRKVIDAGDSFTLTLGSTATTAWVSNPGAFTYAYPKVDIDKFDNLYVPIHSAGTVSAIVYAKLGNGTSSPDNANELATITLTDNPNAYSVSADPNVPDYPSSFTNTRAETVFLGTELTAGKLSVQDLTLVTAAASTGSPRARAYLGVVNGGLYKFTSSSASAPANFTSPLTANPVFDTTSQYISAVEAFRKAYFTDGINYIQYDPITDTVAKWISRGSGVIPPRCKLVSFWRGRMILARSTDDPHNWFMSRLGDATDFDFFPPTPDTLQAFAGNLSKTGLAPGIITGIAPYSDDLCFFGCENAVYRLDGDPGMATVSSAGGRFSLVTDQVGMTFGHGWTKDPFGNFYFFGNRGGVHRIAPGSVPVSMTDGRITRRLRDIDLSVYHVKLEWLTREHGLLVLQFPYATHATNPVKAWFWSMENDAWCELEFTGDTRPNSSMVISGDAITDRILLLGGGTGLVLKWDETKQTDDGTPIGWKTLVGPLFSEDETYQAKVSGLMALVTGEMAWTAHQGVTPTSPGRAVGNGVLKSGRNLVGLRCNGESVWVRFQGLSRESTPRPVIQSLQADVWRGARRAGST